MSSWTFHWLLLLRLFHRLIVYSDSTPFGCPGGFITMKSLSSSSTLCWTANVTGIFEGWAPLSFHHKTSVVARWPRRLGVLCLAQKPFYEGNQNLEHGVARMTMFCLLQSSWIRRTFRTRNIYNSSVLTVPAAHGTLEMRWVWSSTWRGDLLEALGGHCTSCIGEHLRHLLCNVLATLRTSNGIQFSVYSRHMGQLRAFGFQSTR